MATTRPRRILIHIPIVHTEEEMGSLGRSLPVDPARRRLKQARWTQIGRQVQALALDWPGVKVYQDGLPDAGADVLDKVLADVPGPNYDLLRWLVAKGAALVGTESPALLKEEYDYLRAIVTAKEGGAKARARRTYAERAGALLAERDAYIARRIDATLPPDGVGLIFLGQTHRLAGHLPADVEMQSLPSLITTSNT